MDKTELVPGQRVKVCKNTDPGQREHAGAAFTVVSKASGEYFLVRGDLGGLYWFFGKNLVRVEGGAE